MPALPGSNNDDSKPVRYACASGRGRYHRDPMKKARRQPPSPQGPALLREALAAHRQGRLLQAELLYGQALAAAPDDAIAHNLLGALKCQQGETAAGLAHIDQALRTRPGFADAHNHRGNALLALGRVDEALASFERAVAIEPRHAEALSGKGGILLGLGRAAEALACFERLLSIAPGDVDARYNRGNALQRLGRHAEAIASYERALALDPGDAEALNNRGISLRALGRDAEALASFERALAIAPAHVDALNNRGNALKALGRLAEAVASYGQALEHDAGHGDVHLNLGLACLSAGDWPRGWREYAWRHRAKSFGFAPRDFAQPQWDGTQDPAGRTILLHAEQGFGDTVFFARYAPLVAARGARVVLEVPPRLKLLLEQIDGVDHVIGAGESLPDFDLHCPLPGLPLAFGTTPDNVPARVPYLAAPDAHAQEWRARLAGSAAPRVGIAWSGNPGFGNDRTRSVELAELAPVLATPGIRFISVQKDLREDEASLLARFGIPHFGAEQRDFRDAAALVAHMDLVISVDTSIAHLAGALARPVWLMLSFSPDWRWMRDRDDTPWYPHTRLFRHARADDWSGTVARLADTLARWRAALPKSG